MQEHSDIEQLVGEPVSSMSTLSGGCVGDVSRVVLRSGRSLVVKIGGEEIDREARMFGYLHENTELPVPAVVAHSHGMLAMEFVESHPTGDRANVERDAAHHLASLHKHTSPDGRYGFDWPTAIGGLDQPNPWCASWAQFYGEHRVLHMARLALDAGRVGAGFVGRVERLATRLDELIGVCDAPALVHGDVWSGNVLTRGDRVAAYIDPAISFSDREVELAFVTMFGTFGDAFFETYHSLFPIRDGFWENRKDLYLLYPTLVHVRLFGGGYIGQAEAIIDRFT